MASYGNTSGVDLSDQYSLADLVAVKSRFSRPPIIALCAPISFPYWLYNKQLEDMLLAKIVLPLGQGAPHDADPGYLMRRRTQTTMSLWMIDLADEMFVLNIDGVMDAAMMQEYQYASDQRKSIRFLMNMCGVCNQWVLATYIESGVHIGCPVSWRR